MAAHQIGRHRWQLLVAVFRPAILDADALVLGEARFTQTLPKRRQRFRAARGREAAEQPDDRQPLLRARRERPCNRRAAEQRDELAPFYHSITSSARASSVGGTSRLSILAVSALMTNSNLLACTTGRSAGFAPLRMRPT